jgi:hypothetical protein
MVIAAGKKPPKHRSVEQQLPESGIWSIALLENLPVSDRSRALKN